MNELFSSNLLPFTISILAMFSIALLEGVSILIGATLSSMLDALMPDFDVNAEMNVDVSQDGLTKILGWLNVGKVPVLVIIVAFLTAFGLVGLSLQILVSGVVGFYLNIFIAIPITFAISLPFTRSITNLLQKILPKDETSAIKSDDFIGQTAVIILGKSSKNNPAEAKFIDIHGQTHYMMVEPEYENIEFEQGELVIISRKGHSGFYAIKNENEILK